MGSVSIIVIILAVVVLLIFVGALIALGVILAHNRKTPSEHAGSQQKTVFQPTPILKPIGHENSVRDLDDVTLAALNELIEQKLILNAIHLYRESTGADLANATAAVEALRIRNNNR